MRVINTRDAVGTVICHDITRIKKDGEKGAAFQKGHIVRAEDIEPLLAIGKEHLYVWEKAEGMLHEDEAVEYLAAACQSEAMYRSSKKEGKIELFADRDGLFMVDTDRLLKINGVDDVVIATRNTLQYVQKGDKLAGMRVIPLVIEEEKLLQVKEIADEQNPILKLESLRLKQFGVVTTGSELYHGRIQDEFTPVIVEKLERFGAAVVRHEIVTDSKDEIKKAILKLKAAQLDGIICTGGMSVDPDDLTPAAIQESGATVITYGAPVLPGAMFLMGYFTDATPIIGLPGCVMYAKATIFDLMLPRILAGIRLSKQDFIRLGNGGLCLSCPTCHYPNCGFGKGV